MYSISKLADKYHLSRTTLLYYESIGLLAASSRTQAGYRMYSEQDAERLAQIVLFRDMGIPLEEIKGLLTETESRITAALLKQINEINREIQQLRTRQDRIIQMLRKTNLLNQYFQADNRDELHQILTQAGIDETNALKWHAEFENASPVEHEQFLRLVGFSAAERNEMIHIIKSYLIKDESH